MTAVTQGGECWWRVLSLAEGLRSREDASHSMGFIVRAAKMSPFSPLHLAFEASMSRAQVGMLWAAAQEKPHALAQGHGGLGGAHKVGMEGGVSR